MTGGNFSVPVIGKTKFFQLFSHFADVFPGPFARFHTVFDGSVFSRKSEGVPAHRMEHVKALHFLETSQYVADGIVSHMTHMELAGRIREHLQNVILFFIRIFCYLEHVAFCPFGLPFFLDFAEIILVYHFLPPINRS